MSLSCSSPYSDMCGEKPIQVGGNFLQKKEKKFCRKPNPTLENHINKDIGHTHCAYNPTKMLIWAAPPTTPVDQPHYEQRPYSCPYLYCPSSGPDFVYNFKHHFTNMVISLGERGEGALL